MALRNDRGFSLVELMVSVAIVGILASVGVQNYDQILAKSRITRVGAELSGLRTTVEALKATYGYYPSTGFTWRAALPYALQYQVDCQSASMGQGAENDSAFRELCQTMADFNPVAPGLPRQSPYCAEPRDYLYLSDGRSYTLLAYCFDRSELSPLAPPNRCGGGVCWGLAFTSTTLNDAWR